MCIYAPSRIQLSDVVDHSSFVTFPIMIVSDMIYEPPNQLTESLLPRHHQTREYELLKAALFRMRGA